MKIYITEDYKALSRKAANIVSAQVKVKSGKAFSLAALLVI